MRLLLCLPWTSWLGLSKATTYGAVRKFKSTSGANLLRRCEFIRTELCTKRAKRSFELAVKRAKQSFELAVIRPYRHHTLPGGKFMSVAPPANAAHTPFCGLSCALMTRFARLPL